jgi:hypothetical protein
LPSIVRKVHGMWLQSISRKKRTQYTKMRGEKNSVALVREQSVPTERPSLVGEVCANFLWIGVAWSAQQIPTAIFSDFVTGRKMRKPLEKSHFKNQGMRRTTMEWNLC